jgi:hypothetical protein
MGETKQINYGRKRTERKIRGKKQQSKESRGKIKRK